MSTKKQVWDFGNLLGGSTLSAKKESSYWDNIDLADATNFHSQDLAKYFIEFHKELIDKPDMDGIIEPSASLANERALMIARDSTHKSKVLCSNLTHVSIQQACDKLRLDTIVLDVNPKEFQISEEDIAEAIDRYGDDIAAVVSTYGTTQLGNAETLAESESVKKLRDSAWLHIDAAYGGVLSQLSTLIAGSLPDADSIALDPYKFIGKPGCALLLTKKEKLPSLDVPYYIHSSFTMWTTLSTGPLVAWYKTLEDCSQQGLRELADMCVYLARNTAMELNSKGVSLVQYLPKMAIVPIALDSKEQAASLHKNLLDNNFRVGKLNIKGKDYEIHGLRMVVTPKTELEYQFNPAMMLAHRIAKYIN